MKIHKFNGGTNASLTSIIQRFSDIFVMFFSTWFICLIQNKTFTYLDFQKILITLVIFQMIGGIMDFYRSWRGVNFAYEIQLLLKNWSLSYFVSVTMISVILEIEQDIYHVVYLYVMIFSLLVIARYFIRKVIGQIRRYGFNTRNIAIVGGLPQGIDLAYSFLNQSWLGYKVYGLYDNCVKNHERIKYKGSFEKLIIDAKKSKFDLVYINLPMAESKVIEEVIDQLADSTCSVMLLPDVFTFSILKSRLQDINGTPVVPIFESPISGVNRVIKRIEDILLSVGILLFISPVLVLIGFAVKFTSSGPIIFKQVRYGIDGKEIYVWKFRTMTVMENGSEVIQAKKGDSRLTPIGAFLRRTSLDELPQFINVLKGDMSIVGPRPHAVIHNEQYRGRIKGYMLRHKVKPGITGLAQIMGWRGETDTLEKMEKRIEYDLEYIRIWSVWLDLKIIILTVFKGFINKSAY